ncbi:hypothetical protein BH10PSE11_BH10PSE11_37230 [soil metagenome]
MGWTAYPNTIGFSQVTGICLVESPQVTGEPSEPRAGDVWNLEFPDNSRGQATVLRAAATELSIETGGKRWLLGTATAAEVGAKTPELDSTNWKVIASLT